MKASRIVELRERVKDRLTALFEVTDPLTYELVWRPELIVPDDTKTAFRVNRMCEGLEKLKADAERLCEEFPELLTPLPDFVEVS